MLKTCRTFIKKLKATTDKDAFAAALNSVTSKIDKLAKRNIIH